MSFQANLRAELHRFQYPGTRLQNGGKARSYPFLKRFLTTRCLGPKGGAAPLPVRLGKIGLWRAVVLNAPESELTEPVSNPEQGESQMGAQPRSNETPAEGHEGEV